MGDDLWGDCGMKFNEILLQNPCLSFPENLWRQISKLKISAVPRMISA
jgi:hypothetical protein